MELVAAKEDNSPLPTVISPTANVVVASDEVNVNANVASLDVPPSETSAAVMVTVGAVLSKVTDPEPLVTAVPALPAESVYAML